MNKKPIWQRLSLRRSPFEYTKVQAVVGQLKRNRPGNIKSRG